MSNKIVPFTNADLGLQPKGELAKLFGSEVSKESAVKTGGSSYWPLVRFDSAVINVFDEQYEELQCIILGYVLENRWYDTPYSANNPQSPACYAIGTDPGEMKPGPDAPDPQHESCEGCWANAWGSGSGRGKDCMNRIRIIGIAVPEADDASAIDVAPGFRLIPSVTNVGSFTDYAKKVHAAKRPLSSIVTRISIRSDERTRYKLAWTPVGMIDDADVFARVQRRASDGEASLLVSPVIEQSDDVTTPKPKSKAGNRRKVEKKSTGPVRKKVTRKRGSANR